MKTEDFVREMSKAYVFDGVNLGTGVLNGENTGVFVKIPFSTLNRHVLVTGATGTGKTKTVSRIIEELALAGVPSLFMDMKGDVSGIGYTGAGESWAVKKFENIGQKYTPKSFEVEYLSFDEGNGIPLRMSISKIGINAVSKIFDLTPSQRGSMAILLSFAKNNSMTLDSISDLRDLILYVSGEGREIIEKEYGSISSDSLSVIRRKLLEIESSDTGGFFGSPHFDVEDLLETRNEEGVVSVLRMNNMLNDPHLIGATVYALINEIFDALPEVGDTTKPRLAFVIDEAHLLFADDNKELKEKMEMVIKLIRSKGVSIIFCTQTPNDIPSTILSQIGAKVSHSLRAFTAKDNKMIDQMADNYPLSIWYDTKTMLTSLPIGQALITALSPHGNPTPLVICDVLPPQSRMGTITEDELKTKISESKLFTKYAKKLTPKKRIVDVVMKQEEVPLGESDATSRNLPNTKSQKDESVVEEILKSKMVRDVTKTVAREAVKGIIGALFKKRR